MSASENPVPPNIRREVRIGRKQRSSVRRFGPTAVLALAVLAGLAAWLVVESRKSSTTKSQSVTSPPVALSAAGLATLAGAVSQPIYWVGTRTNTSYELTRASGRVYLRYLPPGVAAGNPGPYLTIGTYDVPNAFAVVKKIADTPGAVWLDTPGGGIAVVNTSYPTSVYVAYPGSDFEIELYSPDAATAKKLAASGSVQPVVRANQQESSGPLAVSPAKLRSLAASLGHPIYWAGPRGKTTYELTQTADGRTYVRYLPEGVPVGDKKPYLTIATYPVANAFTVTKASGKGSSTVTMKLPNGGIAVYGKQNPTNVHLADPGSDVQVEVYDPSPKIPPKLVSSGRVAPVG